MCDEGGERGRCKFWGGEKASLLLLSQSMCPSDLYRPKQSLRDVDSYHRCRWIPRLPNQTLKILDLQNAQWRGSQMSRRNLLGIFWMSRSNLRRLEKRGEPGKWLRRRRREEWRLRNICWGWVS